jgi:hypothetical protein
MALHSTTSLNGEYNYGSNANLPVVGPVYTSEAHAELNAVTITSGGIGTDAPIQNLGTAGNPDNSFIKIDRNGYYSSGDAKIWQPPDHATNMGEVYVVGSGTGGAGGTNSLSGTIVLTIPTVLAISFDAKPYLEVQTTGTYPPTDWARANLAFTINVTDAQGNSVFNWSPDGKQNNEANVNDTDGADLNHNLFANPLIPGPLVYGCPGQGQVGAGTLMMTDPAVLQCSFVAFSKLALDAGNYNIDVTMLEHTHASIPEPGSIFLLGIGLMGLVYGRRKMAHNV